MLRLLSQDPYPVAHNMDSVQDRDPVHQDPDPVPQDLESVQDPDHVTQYLVYSLGLWACSQFSETLSCFEKQSVHMIDC